MLALHMLPQHLAAFRVLVVLAGVTGLIFWRTTFKIIIFAVVILIALMVAAFALGFLQGTYHFIR
jgi:hypothetical protein